MKAIMSIERIINMLIIQANLRAPENDEAGILLDAAKEIGERVKDLERPL